MCFKCVLLAIAIGVVLGIFVFGPLWVIYMFGGF